MPFVAVLPFSLNAERSESYLTQMTLHHVIGSFSQATSEDSHIGDITVRVLIQFGGAY
jgi:hypothetical protein